jgi:hypothetical protein
MFRGSVKGTGYPLHSPVSPSLPLPYATVCHHVSTGLYLHLKGSEEHWNLSTIQYGGTAVTVSNTTTDIWTLFLGAHVQYVYTQRVQSVGVQLHPINHSKPRKSSGVSRDLWCRIMDPNESDGNAFKMRHRRWWYKSQVYVSNESHITPFHSIYDATAPSGPWPPP